MAVQRDRPYNQFNFLVDLAQAWMNPKVRLEN